jgi:cytochrome P450 family 142 subfamily A polypeptide 1
MMDKDPPDHTKRRKLVNRGFTPARVRDHEARIRALTDRLIDGFCEQGECDFRHDLAAQLPLVVICDMLGIPAADHAHVLDLSDRLLGSLQGASDNVAVAMEAFGEWNAYARQLIDDRRDHPSDDLVSVLVHAEVDGDRLTDDELVFEILLLLLGGDETTRNVACGGLEALLLHPDQWARLQADLAVLPTAVEELLRWVTPIQYMARTVVADTELAGQRLAAGDTVLMLYEAANFDEEQFSEPDRFAVDRSPNDHVAFGFGAHHCLGASLARLELRVLFERVLARLPDLAMVGDTPPRTIIGISSMPVRFTPTRPGSSLP